MENTDAEFYSKYAEELYWFVTEYFWDDYTEVMGESSMAQFIDCDPDKKAQFYAFVNFADVE